MKRIKIPKLQRLSVVDEPFGLVHKNVDGNYVAWVEVRMLLSILAGHGIIQVVDADFAVSDIEIDDDSDDEGWIDDIE